MTFPCRALLFDLDGTVISSIAAVDQAWTIWLTGHGLSPAEVLPTIHGRRSIDLVRVLVPHLDHEEENLKLRELETSILDGVTEMPGAQAFLRTLPLDQFAYVTSGTQDVAMARLQYVGFPMPSVCVFGDDVAQGKPAPDPFALAAVRLGMAAADCVAFEDTVAGVRSAVAAGCQTVAIDLEESLAREHGAIATIHPWAGVSVEIAAGRLVSVTL